MIQTSAKIESNTRLTNGFFRVSVVAPKIAKEAHPGQLVLVRVASGTEPLLRRPFGFHRIKQSGFELLYKVVGKGTQLLSEKRRGEEVDIIGPLGNGFEIPDDVSTAILVGGGRGVAPLLALASTLRRKTTNHESRATGHEVMVLFGAKTKEEVVCVEDFRALGCEVRIATEDGSLGHKGVVTDLLDKGRFSVLESRTTNHEPRATAIYACGQRAMLAEVAAIARQNKWRCQVSMEEFIACGVGACLGCMIQTKVGLKRVCKDGPIFDSAEVVW